MFLNLRVVNSEILFSVSHTTNMNEPVEAHKIHTLNNTFQEISLDKFYKNGDA